MHTGVLNSRGWATYTIYDDMHTGIYIGVLNSRRWARVSERTTKRALNRTSESKEDQQEEPTRKSVGTNQRVGGAKRELAAAPHELAGECGFCSRRLR